MAVGDEIVDIRGRRHVVTDCRKCGVVYTVPEVMYDTMRADGGFAHCQNGHSWGWREGTKQRDELRAERDRLKQDAARLCDELNAANKKVVRMEADIVRNECRAKAGVCPCCKRTFKQLAAHMKTKHPQYATQQPGKAHDDGLEADRKLTA